MSAEGATGQTDGRQPRLVGVDRAVAFAVGTRRLLCWMLFGHLLETSHLSDVYDGCYVVSEVLYRPPTEQDPPADTAGTNPPPDGRYCLSGGGEGAKPPPSRSRRRRRVGRGSSLSDNDVVPDVLDATDGNEESAVVGRFKVR